MIDMRPGREFAGYRVIELVGAGGMGRVYRAVQPRLERIVALKVIRPDVAAEPSFRERFEREARLAASVDHPNVVPVYEAGDEDGVLFVAMRWVAGPDLARLLRAEGPFEPDRALHVVTQVAAGLEAAHRVGLVHRDVKPANVLTEGGRIYLADFGLARSLAGGDAATITAGFAGTVDYTAPEVVDGSRADASADVYALGCMLFELLTGSVPYPVEGLLAKLHAHSAQSPPAPSTLRPELGFRLDAVMARALAKDPAERFATPMSLAKAAGEAMETREQTRGRRRRLVGSPRRIAIAALALLGGAVGLAVALPGSSRDPSPASGLRSSAAHDYSSLPPPTAGDLTSSTHALPVCAGGFGGPPVVCRARSGGIRAIGDKGHLLRMETLALDVTGITIAGTLRDSTGGSVKAPQGTKFVVVDIAITDRTSSPHVFERNASAIDGRETALWLVGRRRRIEPYHGPGGADYSVEDLTAIGALARPAAGETLLPGIPFDAQLLYYYPTSELEQSKEAILEMHELGARFDDLRSLGAVRMHL